MPFFGKALSIISVNCSHEVEARIRPNPRPQLLLPHSVSNGSATQGAGAICIYFVTNPASFGRLRGADKHWGLSQIGGLVDSKEHNKAHQRSLP